MKLLLDTCTFLWIIAGNAVITPRVRAALSAPGAEIYFSAASAWEISLKHERGRLPLPAPPGELVPRMRERYAIDPLPIDEESALHIAKLPVLHRDPFDRMLVSQAIVHGLTIVTPDPLISQYPARTLW